MKESYAEGVATDTAPESCVVACKGEGEALTGGKAGRVFSREILCPMASPRVLRGADAVRTSGMPRRTHRQRDVRADPARSEPLMNHPRNAWVGGSASLWRLP